MDEMREFNLDEVSLFCVVRDILKNFWVLILAAATAYLAVNGAAGLLYMPEYTATATMAVSAKGNNSSVYSSLTMANQMAEVFSEVFDSNVLREKIAEDLGQETIKGEISSSIIEETNLIVLDVTSVNPRQAYLIIQSAIENYDTVSDYLFSNAVLKMVQEPTVPVSPSNVPNFSRIQKLAMLGAIAGAGALIVLASLLRFTVKTRTGARRNLDGAILGVLPYERKNKTFLGFLRKKRRSILITSSLVSSGYLESVRKLATRLDHRMRRKGQKVIMVSSVAENEGKSSIASNVALALAEKGRRVLLVDTDLKKPAQHKIFEKPGSKGKSLTDYLDGKASMAEVMSSQKNGRMKQFIRDSRNLVDYLILDSSPMSLASDTELLMKLADTAVLIVRQDWTDIRAVNDAVDNIGQSGTDFSGFVLNVFQRESLFRNGQEYRYYGYRFGRRAEGRD